MNKNEKRLKQKIKYWVSSNMDFYYLCTNWFNDDGSCVKPKKVLYHFIDDDGEFSLVLEDGQEVAAGGDIDEFEFYEKY